MTVLKRRVESAAATETIETVTLALYRSLTDVLVPVIGDAGVQALESRALHITQQSYGPSTAPKADPSTKPAEPLREWLRQLEPAVAIEAAGAMLTSLTVLLATFIGGGLTKRLLEKAWTDRPSESDSKETHP